MLQRIRRSFRRKKASYCINCGHVSKDCYHKEYENVDFRQEQQLNDNDCVDIDSRVPKTDDLKWLDLDLDSRLSVLHHNSVNRAHHNAFNRVQRQLMQDELRRPQSLVYSNEYVEMPTYSLPYDNNQVRSTPKHFRASHKW